MKKRIIPMLALLLALVILSLASCSLLPTLGGGADSGDKKASFDGTYEAIDGYPKVKLMLRKSGGATVMVGSKTMEGSYTARLRDDGVYDMSFDFGEQTLPRCNIRTGTYPVTVGETDDGEYMMIFGSRFNKAK